MTIVEKAVQHMITLENMINERDQWLSLYSLYRMQRDFLRRYGLEHGEEDIQQHIDNLDKQVMFASDMLDGVEQELRKTADKNTAEEARNHLIHLKTVLNAYADKTGEQFARRMNLPEQEMESLETLLEEMSKNG